MAPLTLSQLLDVAIGTSRDGAVDLPSLHRLLQSVLGHLGLQDLPVLEPGHRPTALLEGHQATKDQPGLEKEEDRTQGTGQQPREPEEHLPRKEPLQGTASGSQGTSLADDVGQMKITANEISISQVESLVSPWGMGHGLAVLGGDAGGPVPLAMWPESTGGQSAPAKPPQSDMDKQRGASSALGPKGPGTEPVPRTREGSPGTQPGALGMQEGAQGTPAPPEKSAGLTSIPANTSDASATMQPEVPGTQTTMHFYGAQRNGVDELTFTHVNSTEFEKQHQLLMERGQQSMAHILADLQTQVSSLQGWVSSLQGMDYELEYVKHEVRQLEEAFGKLGLAGDDGKAGSSDQSPLQLGSAQQEMIQATLETLVTRRTKQLQAQLDELRAIVESAGQELAGGILDTRMHVAQLVQHVVTSQQDEQLLKHIQASVRQVQGDCEKLRIVLQGLLDHRCQEEKSIEALSRCVERLEEEKAGKEELLLGIAAKADKTSLAGKVSHSQFEASVEQLKEKMEELTSRVTGQEQGWHQVHRRLREEMDSKLDRLELGPFRQQLEEQWNSLQEQLEEKVSRAAAGEVAGIKKQLLARFQGLSCDQPLSMPAPGPEQTGECQRPPVPPSCGDQHTILPPQQRCLQPHPPSTPRPQQPFARLPSKLRVTQHKATELLGRDRRISRDRQDGQLPVRGGKEGTTASSEHKSASSQVSRAPGLFPPLQPPRDASAPREPGRTGGPRLLQSLQPPRDTLAPRELGRTRIPRLLQPLRPQRDASAPREPGRTRDPWLLQPLQPPRDASAPRELGRTRIPRLLQPLRPQRDASAPQEPDSTGGPRLNRPRNRQ
ncbi:uncharacterized protein [Patagioenas fasciata]|uniref:uncharacterized protein n=1 Tax=Patagioenas fasciata TaxID=372321 RepID=UPI003A99299F